MVGHTFEYNPAVRKVKEIILSGDLGHIYCIKADRASLGLFQTDVNVIWDLAPHDLFILLYLLDQQPRSVQAIGDYRIFPKLHEIAYMHGDEVITAAKRFIATALAISYTEARPVFVDIDPPTFNIDPDQLSEAITNKTKAVIPVHLNEQLAPMDPILELAVRHGLIVIEHACQAHGARYTGKRVGSLGDAAAFSFYPAKKTSAPLVMREWSSRMMSKS